jgi:hypothetical protein
VKSDIPSNTLQINLLNVAGADDRPNGTLFHSYNLPLNLNAVLCLSSGAIGIVWYAAVTSILENILAPCS